MIFFLVTLPAILHFMSSTMGARGVRRLIWTFASSITRIAVIEVFAEELLRWGHALLAGLSDHGFDE